MRAARVDGNQQLVVEYLRAHGVSVQPLSSVGGGCPDLACGFRGRNYFLELKDESQPPSKQILTLDQVNWHLSWKGQVCVVNSPLVAWEVVSGLKTGFGHGSRTA